MNFIDIKIETLLDKGNIKSFGHIYRISNQSKVKYWAVGILAFLIIFLFIPWTQNISAKGAVTTLRQEQRPQQVNTIIPGKVAKWHVKEGDFVKAGDTIMQLSEIKDDYLDPNLLQRTKEQMIAKEMTVSSYKSKVGTADMQIEALTQSRGFKVSQIENKLRQQRLKVQADSMDQVAAGNDLFIATKQFARQKNMFDSGLV